MTSDSAKFNVPTVKKPLLKSSSRVDGWLVTVLVCFTLLAWANWGKVEYPIIDVGREVEISSRLLTGQLLYRDITTYYGPLAYYANALALLLFGQRLEVFYAVGLGLALAATLLFYRLAKRLTNASWAALCTGCMLIYCAIGPGLFHFIIPYSYGAAYAVVLCLVAITALDNYACTGRKRWLVAAAIACGLAGLAKQEYGVAALFSVLVGANLYRPQNLRTRVGRSLLVLVVAGICVFLPFALLAQQISWEKLYLSLFPLHQVSILNRSTIFQISPAKTLHIWWMTFTVFFASSLVVLLSMIAAHWLLKPRWVNMPESFKNLAELLAGFAFTLISFGLLKKLVFHSSSVYYSGYPIKIFQPLGNLSWCLPVLIGWFAFNRPRLPQDKHAPLLWTLLVFSLLLNSRWLFYVNFYGLFAAPVVLLFFTVLYYLTQRTGKGKVVWCYLLVCLLCAGSMKLGEFAQYRYAVSSSHGTLYTTDADLARASNQAINAIKASRATSVLVLPEGNILNFLTATYSPSRELTFLPVALPTSVDEQDFIERMQANPPELIAYVDRHYPEWGYRNFAQFNPLVDKWITQQHRLIHVFPKDEGGIIRIYAPNLR